MRWVYRDTSRCMAMLPMRWAHRHTFACVAIYLGRVAWAYAGRAGTHHQENHFLQTHSDYDTLDVDQASARSKKSQDKSPSTPYSPGMNASTFPYARAASARAASTRAASARGRVRDVSLAGRALGMHGARLDRPTLACVLRALPAAVALQQLKECNLLIIGDSG